MTPAEFKAATPEEVTEALGEDFKIIATDLPKERSAPDIGQILTVDVPAALSIFEKLAGLFSSLFGHPHKHFAALDAALTQQLEVNKHLTDAVTLLEARVKALEAKG